MRSFYAIMFAAVALVIMNACAGTTQPPAPAKTQLAFQIQLSAGDEGKVQAGLVVQNSDRTKFSGDEQFGGRMELRDLDDTLRAAADIVQLGSIAGGEGFMAMRWEGELTPGTYEMTWGAPAYGTTTLRFQVSEDAGRLQVDEMSTSQQRQS